MRKRNLIPQIGRQKLAILETHQPSGKKTLR